MPTLVETIAESCFPMFDGFVSSAIEASLREHGEFSMVCSGIYEIGPKFADGGVCLEATKSSLDDVALGAGFYIVGVNEDVPPIFQVSVAWHRSWTHDRQA